MSTKQNIFIQTLKKLISKLFGTDLWLMLRPVMLTLIGTTLQLMRDRLHISAQKLNIKKCLLKNIA